MLFVCRAWSREVLNVVSFFLSIVPAIWNRLRVDLCDQEMPNKAPTPLKKRISHFPSQFHAPDWQSWPPNRSVTANKSLSQLIASFIALGGSIHTRVIQFSAVQWLQRVLINNDSKVTEFIQLTQLLTTEKHWIRPHQIRPTLKSRKIRNNKRLAKNTSLVLWTLLLVS